MTEEPPEFTCASVNNVSTKLTQHRACSISGLFHRAVCASFSIRPLLFACCVDEHRRQRETQKHSHLFLLIRVCLCHCFLGWFLFLPLKSTFCCRKLVSAPKTLSNSCPPKEQMGSHILPLCCSIVSQMWCKVMVWCIKATRSFYICFLQLPTANLRQRDRVRLF
jgi:hypothetical protein